MSFSTPYHTLRNFNCDSCTSEKLLLVTSVIDDLEVNLNEFSNLVSRYTRRENRAYLVYLIDMIKDELSEHPKELKEDEFINLANVLGEQFDEIMEATRNKDLYKCGERLRTCLTAYDKHYEELKKVIAQSEL